MSFLHRKMEAPFSIYEFNLSETTDEQLAQISDQLGLALSLEEMKSIQTYCLERKKNPTDLELQTIGQTWSEHCFHKTFKGDVVSRKGNIVVRSMFKNYIARATRELNYPWCLSVFEDNAGIVEFTEGYGIAAKVETHNHPSAVEPFGGAATGTGGVIRDPLGVWAYPIACTDVLCFGPLDYDYSKLPPGIKHPRYLYRGVVSGIGHYGNNMGIPTVNGAIYFDESYVGNIVVYCGCIGILPMDKFIRDTKPGDYAVLVGGRTGRDGIHGVTFASAELTEKSGEVSRSAVQIPNPVEEEKIKRALINVRDRRLGSSVTDLGGGGLSCAAGEMANRASCGIHIELDKVQLKHVGLAPWEIWISESQERMLLSVRESNLGEALEIFEGEEVEATPVGRFTGDGTLKVDYQGFRLAEIELKFLFKQLKVTRVAEWLKPNFPEFQPEELPNLNEALMKLLSAPNIACKETVVRTYDHEVQGNTALKPLQGQFSGPNDAAVLKPLENSWMGITVSCGMNPNYGKIDPYWMAASGIDEALRNSTAVGGRRNALLDNFSWGNPEKPDRLGSLVRAVKACYRFAKSFGAPFISGKDSLYNESPLGPVTPTLLITAVGIIPDVRKTVSMELKKPGDKVYIAGRTYPELGGSEYYKLFGSVGRTAPKVRPIQAKAIMEAIIKAIDDGCVKACHDCSEGGLAVAAAEMAFSGNYGLRLSLGKIPRSDLKRNDHILFSESNSRFLIEVSPENERRFEALMRNLPCSAIGYVEKENYLLVEGLDGRLMIEAGLNDLRKAWKTRFGG